MYSINLIIFIFVTLITLAACTSKTIGNKNSSVPQTAKAQDKTVDKDFEKLKLAIKNTVNDDIWYNGPYSDYKRFEMQKSGIEVYLNSKFPKEGRYFILFDNSFQDTNGKGQGFYVIGLNKDEKKGFLNYISLSFMKDTLEKAKSELINSGGDTLLQKGQIEFGKVSKPSFPPLAGKRGQIISKIQEKLPYELKTRYNMKPGKYKAYIRNFRENENFTYVVIEDEKGNGWILTIDITDDENVYMYNMDYISTGKESEYIANQYKKVSILKEIQILDNSEQDNDLTYKSKLGFELLFPESWKGKYLINEKNGSAEILHKYNNKTAMLFTITTESQNDWNEEASTPEKIANLPVKKIGEKEGVVFVYYLNEQPPYMDNSEEAKNATDEYNKLVNDISEIISRFKVIN